MSEQKEGSERIHGYITILMNAIKENDVTKVKLILEKKKPYLDEKIRDGYTPLIWAVAYKKNPKFAKLLVEDGANVDVENNEGYTPLIFASQYGETDLVNFFLQAISPEKKVEYINHQGKPSGNNALLLTSEYGNDDIAEQLLNEGADIYAKNIEGNTALLLALKGQKFVIVKLLIDRGADVLVQNKLGETPLMYAALYGYELLIEDLLKRIETHEEKKHYVNKMTQYGTTALMIASDHGHTAAVQLLLNNDAEVDVFNNNGQNAVDFARDKPEILQLLLNKLEKERNWKNRKPVVELHEHYTTHPDYPQDQVIDDPVRKFFSNEYTAKELAGWLGGGEHSKKSKSKSKTNKKSEKIKKSEKSEKSKKTMKKPRPCKKRINK